MKWITYKFLSCEINHGTEEKPDIKQVILDKKIACSTDAILEANLSLVKAEAYNGEYAIEDDGQSVPVEEATPQERIAELEEAFALLLSGVTE